MMLSLSACGIKKSSTPAGVRCDIDISTYSTTMAYSQVNDFNQNPKNYGGKIIKMTGTFDVETANGRNYYSCNIKDSGACCSAKLVFVLKDDLKYPDDYPKIGDTITVMGKFETYIENGKMLCQLKNASFCK